MRVVPGPYLLWFEDHSRTRFAAHHGNKGVFKMQMPHAPVFLDRRLCSQPLPLDKSLARVGIDREVSHLKGGEVLKEVASLGGNHAKVSKPGFDDHPRPTPINTYGMPLSFNLAFN